MVEHTSSPHPFEQLSSEMQRDPDYAWGWHCNLAVPIMDAIGCSHQQANEAAAHLMQHLWSVDITKDDRYAYDKSGAQSYAEMRIAADKQEDAEIAARTDQETAR